MSESMDTVQFGESWLFYGCRYKEQDFLYRFLMVYCSKWLVNSVN